MTIEEIGRNLPALFCGVFVSILFVQSGLDKVFDWKGNLEWLNGHFSKTFLSGMVPLLLGTITVMEIAAGVLSGIAIFYFLIFGSTALVFYASILGAASILALFSGQRIAKDYEGAAVLVPYFLLLIVMMILSNPYSTI